MKAAEIIKRLATSSAAPAGMANLEEDTSNQTFQSGAASFQVNYTFIYPAAEEIKGLQKNIGWARWPRVEPDEPSHVTLGGFNLGVGRYSKNPDLAFEAAECLARPEQQTTITAAGGLAPTTESLYDDPKVKKALPFAALMRESLDEGAPRPVTPAYSDVSLGDPEDVPPAGRDRHGQDPGAVARPARQGRRGEGLLVEAATTTAAKPPTKGLTDRARAERNLAWKLCAPAVIAMLVVTGYPIGYAVYLSLQKFDLRFPDEKEFVGLSNYVDVLTSSTWWTDVFNTLFITVISVGIELVLGMAIALVMHRAIFGRGPVRAAILIPYGIVTVVAAFAWLFAFQPTTGFVQNLPLVSDTADPLSDRWGSFLVIILTEVWKTTPFMALLLLAGLALVPDELHEAAKVDGAGPVQRFIRITLPLMKPAILVALLFRTLDAFRLFDSVFIQTRGANDTEVVSILGYNVLINRLNLGLGSAISVLIFIAVILIALFFVKALGTSTAQQRGEA